MSSIRRNSGTSLVEVLVAIMITSIAVTAALSHQPQAWRLAGKTDNLGRAAGIIQSELERSELWIMNPNNTITLASTSRTVYTGGQGDDYTPQAGDVSYTVQTTITKPSSVDVWKVTVKVTWPGNSTGITESIWVTRQETFRS